MHDKCADRDDSMLDIAGDERADEEDDRERKEVQTAKHGELHDESFNFFTGSAQRISNAKAEVDVHAKTQDDDDPAYESAVLVILVALVIGEFAESDNHHVDDSKEYLFGGLKEFSQ